MVIQKLNIKIKMTDVNISSDVDGYLIMFGKIITEYLKGEL